MSERVRSTALVKSPYHYEFFQAVHLLQRAGGGATPGGFSNPGREFVRFATNQTLAFPASEIQSFVDRESGPPLMTVNFMGLTGPVAALPIVYTTLVMDRLRDRDTTMRDFYDVFNHRIISLFYRAWAKYRFTIAYETGDRGGPTHNLMDLLGIGTKGLQKRLAVADEALIFYSGLLSQRPRSAAALRQVLIDYFDVPVEVEQFVGVWYGLDRNDQCELERPGVVSGQLGVGAVVGDEVWYQQSRVRVVLGPLDRKQYLDFLPGGTAYEPLRAITSFFSDREFDFEARLILKREQAPGCSLGAEGNETPQLGWLTWMNSVGLDRDPSDTVLQL